MQFSVGRTYSSMNGHYLMFYVICSLRDRKVSIGSV